MPIFNFNALIPLSIASNDSALRGHLEQNLKSTSFDTYVSRDLKSRDAELRCAVVLAIGYCVARPQLVRYGNYQIGNSYSEFRDVLDILLPFKLVN